MPNKNDAPGREVPSFSKWGGGGWSTLYEGRTLLAERRKDKDGVWAVYEITGKYHENKRSIAEGTGRNKAVFKAMDFIDEDDPAKPLKDREQAAWWVKVVTEAYPNAMNFEPVTGEDGETIGWTFHVDKGAHRRFGWVSVDRRRAHVLEHECDQAAALLTATVTTSTAEHLALPAQAAAVEREETGQAIAGIPAERGTVPRCADDPSVRAALVALGKFLPEHRHEGTRLAEVTDSYVVGERSTYSASASGALVLPEPRDATGSRVYVYWLEGGEFDRPLTAVPLQMIAEKLSRAGFSIESIKDSRVTALHHAADVEAGEAGEAGADFTDVWSLTNRNGFEIAVVEARSDDAMMDLARCLPHVRATVGTEGDIVRRRVSRAEIDKRQSAGDDALLLAVHHCEERGHAQCGSGTRLVDLDPQGRGRIIPAPVNEVEAVDGGTVSERRLPTYVKGTLLLGIDGKRHQVWETVWREWDGVPVETVITAAGEEHRADRLVEFEGGTRRVETPARKGDTIAERPSVLGRTPLADICSAGHLHVVTGAETLEAFRTGREENRAKWEQSAEDAALWAAAWFYQATGELTVALWRTVVRCAVELHARRYYIGRSHAMDPEPERNSFFGSGRRSLKDRSPEGFNKVLDAARHWVYYLEHPSDVGERERADTALRFAAHEFADALGGDREDWITPVRYLAELHAMTLVEEEAARRARVGH
ncbi:hypothetical protein ACFV42_46490 [Streptomyces solisilvae]|uniref:hypothetical protein n=1 Tax=Streptomyces malaysiensis TaxID=92644 RepID=UPI003673CD78